HYDIGPKRMPDALMPQTDPKYRHPPTELADNVIRKPGFLRRTRSRGNQYSLRLHRARLLHRQLIIPADFHFGIQFAEILHQVVGERVVIIDHQDHRGDTIASILCVRQAKQPQAGNLTSLMITKRWHWPHSGLS